VKTAARELTRLLSHVAIGVLIALVIAVLFALIHGGSFGRAFANACLAVGCIALLLAPAGHQASYRNLETYGRIPYMRAWLRTAPGDTTLAPTAVLGLTAVVLLALGIFLR
jgi:hypothetical protein